MDAKLFAMHEYLDKHEWVKTTYAKLVGSGLELTLVAQLDAAKTLSRTHRNVTPGGQRLYNVYRCKCGDYQLRSKRYPRCSQAAVVNYARNPFT
jgi:hypothetical protein